MPSRALRRGHRHRPEVPIPIICTLLGAPAEDWELFSAGPTTSSSPSTGMSRHTSRPSWPRGTNRRLRRRHGRRRRHTLTDDLISGLIRAEDHGDRLSADELRKLVASLLDGRHRHHAQSTCRRRASTVRPPRPVGSAGQASRVGGECRRGDHAAFPGLPRYLASRPRRCPTRRIHHPGRHPCRRRHRRGQPRSRRLRRS